MFKLRFLGLSGKHSYPLTHLPGPHTHKFQENIPKFVLRLRLRVQAVLQGSQKVLMDLQDVLDVRKEDLEGTKRPESSKAWREQGPSQNSLHPRVHEQISKGEVPLGQAAAVGCNPTSNRWAGQ